MTSTKISIITINYNNLDGLRATLESVFTQIDNSFEYIVIDGGSNDGSLDLIQSYCDRFHFWCSEEDSGIYNAINKGLEKATGEYVLILNSGDLLHSDITLKEALLHLQTGEDIIYGNSLLVNGSFGDRILISPSILNFNFFKNNGLNHQNVFIRKSLYQEKGHYDESLRIASDWKFMLEALSKGASYKHIDMIVCNYDESGISSKNLSLLKEERQKVLVENFAFFYSHETPGKRYLPVQASFIQKLFKIFKFIIPHGLVVILNNSRKKT